MVDVGRTSQVPDHIGYYSHPIQAEEDIDSVVLLVEEDTVARGSGPVEAEVEAVCELEAIRSYANHSKCRLV